MRAIETAVITGPTGVIGQALCRRLLDEGMRVYAVCRPGSARAYTMPERDGLTRIECDLANLDALPQIIAAARGFSDADVARTQVDAFFHLAWSHTTGSGRNDMAAQVCNVQHTIDACHIAAELGCAVFVGAGSQAEYGRVARALSSNTPCFPENGYGMAKLCAGQMSRVECNILGIAHVWPRVLSVYGPYDGVNTMILQVIRMLLEGEKPALTDGEQIWDYLYADDAAEAFYKMALFGHDGAVYPLGSGNARPLREYVKELRDAIDPSLPLGFGEIPYDSQQVTHLEADISAIQKDTGFTPMTPFIDGIAETIEWVRAHGLGFLAED